MAQPRIVILGGGFAGLAAANALKKSPAEIILIDRTNHHLFQPLLYQVATAMLSPVVRVPSGDLNHRRSLEWSVGLRRLQFLLARLINKNRRPSGVTSQSFIWIGRNTGASG